MNDIYSFFMLLGVVWGLAIFYAGNYSKDIFLMFGGFSLYTFSGVSFAIYSLGAT